MPTPHSRGTRGLRGTGEGQRSKRGSLRGKKPRFLPGIDLDSRPFSSPHPLSPRLGPVGKQRTGKVGVVAARGPHPRLGLCEPGPIETSLLSIPRPSRPGRAGGLEDWAAVRTSAPAAPTYLTKTRKGTFLLRGLRVLSCQTWVFQASTFRGEGTCEGQVGPSAAGAWVREGARGPFVSFVRRGSPSAPAGSPGALSPSGL